MRTLAFIILFLASFISSYASKNYSINDTIKNNDTIINKLDTIVIAASKYGQTLKNEPVSVSVISKNIVQKFEINNIGDLNAMVPNLMMQRHGTRLTSPIYIRGIGSRINSPAVGLYVDGIPYFDLGSLNFEMFGVQKIEVLRGPQGTLYGRNTMGGLINVITLQPVNKQEFSTTLQYGNYNQMRAVMHYNQPISKKMIMVFDAAAAKSDGFFENTYLHQSADSYNLLAGRFKFQYTPAQRLKINFVLNYERSRENGYPYAVYDTTTQTISDISYDQPSSYYRDMLSAGLRVKYTAPSFIVQSATSYQSIIDTQRIDQDFTSAKLLYVTQNRNIHYLVEDFSVKSLPTSKIKWVAGLFGFKNATDKDVFVNFYPFSLLKHKTYVLPEDGLAAYGQAALPFGRFTLTAGLRADYEKDMLNYNYLLFVANAQVKSSQVDTFNTYWQILPKISLSYRVGNNSMVYATFSKGYKAGGFNSTFERPQDISFEPEFSYNYEVGVKSSMFENRVFLTADLFYIDWLNQQVYQPVPSGQGAMLKNAGHSMSRGAELSLSAVPMKNLNLWLAAGYDEARYLKYVKDDETDYSGNFMPYIPLYTSNFGFSYSLPVNKKFLKSVQFNSDYQFIGKFYWNDANTAYQHPYGLLNASVVLVNKHFDLGFAGRNLLNADYNAFYFEALHKCYAQKGDPRVIYGFIKFKF